MAANIRTSLFGYNKKKVNELIARVNSEHEEALALKNERFVEMRDQNNFMKTELARYKNMEQEISSVLITAQTKANELIQEGERGAEAEKARLADEIRTLDRLSHALYSRLENTIQQAEDIARGFEQELTELRVRKETFLKTSYEFNNEKGGAGEVWKISV